MSVYRGILGLPGPAPLLNEPIVLNLPATVAATSPLMDLRVGAESKFLLRADGRILLGGVDSQIKILVNQAYSKICNTAGATFVLTDASSDFFTLDVGVISCRSGTAYAWSSSSTASGVNPDLRLSRDAANVLAQRNGTNAQAFRLYNTFTDASNYERVVLGLDGTNFLLRSESAGTGTARELRLDGQAGLRLMALGGTIMVLSSTNINIRQPLIFDVDNTTDIGQSGKRPRNVLAAGYVTTGTTTVASLPSAATAGASARLFVTDANATTFASIVAGGGSNGVPVYSDGTNWRIG
jgi:hypothetical protein